MTMAKTEVAVPTDLASISSYDAARAYALSQGPITSVQELGDGFTVIKSDDKRRLVGVPFITVGIDFGQDETSGREYVVVRLVTKNGSKLVMTDGSTGIKRQIEELINRNQGEVPAFIDCPKGLVASDYVYTAPDGTKGDATTFYFDLSGADSGTSF